MNMKYRIGFKFKPTFQSDILYFEVRGIDEKRDMVLTTVHPKSGYSFDDEIERRYYEGAFINGSYVAIR